VSRSDVLVVGAGVFGAWIAWYLRRAGRRVRLIDAYGVATGRGSSGGDTRVIRAGYGPDRIYTRAAVRSLEAWKDLERRAGQRLFEPTGVLTLARAGDAHTEATWDTLRSAEAAECAEHADQAGRAARVERLAWGDLRRRFPQFAFADDQWGVYEPGFGVLRARQAVRAVVEDAVRMGVEYGVETWGPPAFQAGGQVILACGPWLPKLFPSLLGSRMFVTRQDVFFFGPPPGDRRYAPDVMPAWIDFRDGVYGHADIDGRGVKIAVDRHGPPIDPDTADRHVAPEAVAAIRGELAARLPGLAGAPLLESRVCQYENSANGDFLIDRHPDADYVWIAGGGSGHGFKHGPFVGEYLCGLIQGTVRPEPRFALAAKGTIQRRAVY
jgi:glycine/D-amino acid oxidase-like deaminating enzyme